jgi:branched-chain amino acid transport system ATP-binding protein
MPMLKVRDVTVFLGKAKVVDRASLTVPRGSTVALVGPNGAGKTTLVRAISGVLRISEGEIRAHLDDQQIALTDLSAHEIVRLGISHVPEGRGLFSALSVQDNLIAGSMFPRARRHRKERLEFVFGLFQRLRERSRQISASLSGGEQQMLALGRALMACPELLILDEPSIGLAPTVVAELYRVLRQLKLQTGITLLVIEQDIHHVARICDYAYVMSAGHVVRKLGRGELKAETVKQHYLGASRT